MNTSRKDTLLVALGAFLLVVGGFGYAALHLGVVPTVIKPVVQETELHTAALLKIANIPAAGIVYPNSPKASLEDNVKDWITPEENEDNWDYDLFTTIDVVWNATLKEYVPARRKAEELPPFGLALVSVAHPIYEYILDGVLAPKGKEPVFTLRHVKTKKYLDNAKLNQPIEDAPHLMLIEFRVSKEKDPDGFPFTRNVVKVRDRNLGKDIEIDDQKPLVFVDITDVVLATPTDPSWTKVLKAVGDKFTLNGALYTLKGIDLASKSVSVDKSFAPNPKKPKKILVVSETLAEPLPPPPPAKIKSPTALKSPLPTK